MNGLEYNISLDGTTFASGNSDSSTSISGKRKTVIFIPLDLDLIKLGKSVHSMLSQRSTFYGLNGTMVFEMPGKQIQRFPFFKEGAVPLIH